MGGLGKQHYDPQTHNVRSEVGRLRETLQKYYLNEGQDDPLLIEIPKGEYIARFEDTNIWRIEIPDSAGKSSPSPPNKLIFSTRHDASPQFSPDATKIVFASDRSGSFEIWLCDSDGLNPRQLTAFGNPAGAGSPRWAPEGKQIVFDSRAEGDANIYVISPGGGLPRRLTQGSSEDVVPSYSSDGCWIYFASNRSQGWQVWKMPVDGDLKAVQVTKKGGFAAFESRDGKYVYYAKGRTILILWKVPVAGGEEVPVAESPKCVIWYYWTVRKHGIYFLDFDFPYMTSPAKIKFLSFDTGMLLPLANLEAFRSAYYPGLAVSPDGRWILYSQTDQSASDIMLVENFH